MPAPLDGLRVVDFSRVLAGPHCAKTLLDLGAEVIKVEPPRPDFSRMAFPRTGEISGYYAQQNAGKRNISVDLNVPGAREVVLRLCDSADVVVENFRPGTMTSFGLGYDVLAQRNPQVVYASISGYGQRGPWRSRMAYAPTVHAEAGLTQTTSAQFGVAGPGLRTDSLSHADVYSGLHAAIAILAALHERERTGAGAYIDVAMAAVMMSINERVHVDLSSEELGAETPVLGATDTPFFTGPDGEILVSSMSLVGSLSFPLYLIAMHRMDLATDPRFRTPELRLANRDELHAIVQRWVWTFPDAGALGAQLDLAKVAIGELRGLRDFVATDWAAQWRAVRAVPDRNGGEIKVPGLPWRFRSRDGQEGTSSPQQVPAFQGEHNAEVLAELGYGPEEIAAFRDSGVLIAPRLP